MATETGVWQKDRGRVQERFIMLKIKMNFSSQVITVYEGKPCVCVITLTRVKLLDEVV